MCNDVISKQGREKEVSIATQKSCTKEQVLKALNEIAQKVDIFEKNDSGRSKQWFIGKIAKGILQDPAIKDATKTYQPNLLLRILEHSANNPGSKTGGLISKAWNKISKSQRVRVLNVKTIDGFNFTAQIIGNTPSIEIMMSASRDSINIKWKNKKAEQKDR